MPLNNIQYIHLNGVSNIDGFNKHWLTHQHLRTLNLMIFILQYDYAKGSCHRSNCNYFLSQFYQIVIHCLSTELAEDNLILLKNCWNFMLNHWILWSFVHSFFTCLFSSWKHLPKPIDWLIDKLISWNLELFLCFFSCEILTNCLSFFLHFLCVIKENLYFTFANI